MNHLLELLGRGLDCELTHLLGRYFRAPLVEPIDELKVRCAATPEDSQANLRLGLAYLQQSQPDLASEHLARAVRRDPDALPARLALAAALVEDQRLSEAAEQLRLANQTHSGEPAVLFALGFCLERLGRPDEARDYYQDTVVREPCFAPARERLAAVALQGDEPELAAEQLEYLRHLRPQDPWYRAALGHVHYRAGEYDRAVRSFECALAMEPENWSLVDDQVEALVADGRIPEAAERLEMLLEAQGEFPDLHARLGDMYSRLGDDDAAMREYRRAIDLQPDYLEGHVKLGTQNLIAGRWEEAGEAFQQAATLNDHSMVNYVALGVSQAAQGREDEAMNSFDLASAIEPNSTVLLTEMAKLQLKAQLGQTLDDAFEPAGSPPVAQVDLDNDYLLHRQLERHGQEVETHPEDAVLRYRYGVLLRADGRLGEALEQFAAAVELEPTYVEARIRLGIAQQELGRTDIAIETLGEVLELRPHYVDLHYRLGLLYTDRGEFQSAAEHLMQASRGAPDSRRFRASLALALQNMGLMDEVAATWRSLCRMHPVET